MNWFLENMLTSVISSKVEWMAQKMWVSDVVARQVVVFAVPLIISYLTKNNQNDDAKQGFLKATQDPRNAIDQNPDAIDLWDATKMLGHIFGWDKEQVVQKLSNKAWTSPDQTNDMIGMIAKYVVWWLGKEKQESQLDDDGLLGLLWDANRAISWWSSESNQWWDMLSSLLTWALDKNKDGDYKDDLLQQWASLLMNKLFWKS